MAKGDKFYFENFIECAQLSKKAALYLVSCLENYDADKIEPMLVKMHEYENRADIKKHEMNEALAKAFVTPVDREDLDMMSQQLDNVLDLLEEVLQKLYIYDIKTIQPSAIEYAKNLVNGCDLLCSIMGEFENFKKSKKSTRLLLSAMMLKKYVTDCISHQCVTSPRIRITLTKDFTGTKSMIVLKLVRTPANT